MKKTATFFFIFLLIILCISTSHAQSNPLETAHRKTDSLVQLLKDFSHVTKTAVNPDSVLVDLSSKIFDEFTYGFEAPTQVLILAKKLVVIAKKSGNKTLETTILRKIGNIYLREFIYDSAIEYYLQAIKVAEEINDKINMASSLGNLGNVYARMAELSNPKINYEKALEYHLKALEIFKAENTIKGRVANSLVNTSNIYRGLGLHQKAIDDLLIAKAIYLKENDAHHGVDLVNLNLAETYIDFGKKTGQQKHFEKADEFLTPDLIKDEESTRAPNVFLLKGESSLLQNKLNEGFYYLSKGYKLAKKRQNIESVKNGAQLLAKLYILQNDFETALMYRKAYTDAKDALLNEKSNKQIVGMNSQYENDKKEREIELLIKDKALYETAFSKQKIVSNIFIVGVGLMLFLLLLMYSQFKIKRKLNIQLDLTNKNLVQKNSFIEKQKEKIINNITYAELIQKTIITNHQLPEYFPNSFVLFKPKALVSGDFYWCSKINDTIIVAVADCTGHGVPGAFMSIIGNMLLNQIVNEKKITTPSEILYQLNSAVYNILHQDDERSLSDDGMDIAICSINYSQKQLQFSGAQQPLYLMLNNTLQILKPSIYSIGGRRTLFRKKNPTAISYTNHTIEIENDMYIYLFSDGYTDQFGGPEEKKFSTPRFQNILLENQHISMAKQCELLASKHEQWKGSNQQTDDILVMGLKLTC